MENSDKEEEWYQRLLTSRDITAYGLFLGQCIACLVALITLIYVFVMYCKGNK